MVVNGAKLDKWPETGDYVRPDQGKPHTLFVFDHCGGMAALPTENNRPTYIGSFWSWIARDCAGQGGWLFAYVLNILRDVIECQLTTGGEAPIGATPSHKGLKTLRCPIRRLWVKIFGGFGTQHFH